MPRVRVTLSLPEDNSQPPTVTVGRQRHEDVVLGEQHLLQPTVQVISFYRWTPLGRRPEVDDIHLRLAGQLQRVVFEDAVANRGRQPVALIDQLFESVAAEMLDDELASRLRQVEVNLHLS